MILDYIYRRYRAVCQFCELVFRRENGIMFMPRETWALAWGFWRTWPGHTVYGRDWKP